MPTLVFGHWAKLVDSLESESNRPRICNNFKFVDVGIEIYLPYVVGPGPASVITPNRLSLPGEEWGSQLRPRG